MRKIKVLLACVACCIGFQSQAQQKYALIIGINKYYDKPGVMHRTQLGGCVNDAMSIKNMLLQQFGFKENNIQTLLDAQATKESLVDGLTNILDKAHAGDAVVFYYSGHGCWMTNKKQSAQEIELKHGMNQAMVMSDLYAPNMDCLVRDALLKKIGNKFVDKGIAFTVITDCCFSGLVVMPMLIAFHNPYHRVERYSEGGGKVMYLPEIRDASTAFAKENDSTLTDDSLETKLAISMDEPDPALRAFNLKDPLMINDSAYIIPPSKRPHSMFLGLSASNDIEPSLEEPDETGTRHGIFTKALLDAVKKYGPNIPVSQLYKEILKTFSRQMYSQSPQHHEDPARLNMNLLGIAPAGFSNTLIVPAAGSVGKTVYLAAGGWSGITAGNLLTSLSGKPKITLRVDRAYNDNSEATMLSGNIASIQTGDLFAVTDPYTSSAPLLKVYIGGEKMTPDAFEAFMKNNILPLTALKHYMSYEDWYNITPSWVVNYNDPGLEPEKISKKILRDGNRDSFVVLLPIPGYMADPIKAGVRKNQNVVLVNDPAQADYVLYLNYVRGNKPHFDFTWCHYMSRTYNGPMMLVFINRVANTKGPVLSVAELNTIIPKLAAFPNEFIRETGNHWLNFVPGR